MASAKSIENHIRQLLGELKVSIDVIRQIATDLNIDLATATVEQRKLIAETIKQNHAQLAPINQPTETLPETPTTNTDNQPNFLALLDNQPTATNALSTAQKHELVKLKSVELGIELVDTEVIKIADMVSMQITDSIQFLDEVASLIQQFFADRNNQAKQAIDEKINDIATIINTGNEQLGDIFNGANNRLNQIVEECTQRKADYKSPYKTKLEGIREILKLPA